MTRKTGAIVLVALALSVACLGVLLALRCECGDPAQQPVARPVDTLTVGGNP
jgi:hypothetical protein